MIVNDSVTYQSEEISPDLAREMLSTSQILTPATLDETTVAQYAAIMRAGGWIENGMPVIFDQDGHLLDGHHRLAACVKSGVPLKALVARGVRADTLHTMDQHRRRTYTGVLEARGVAEAGDVSRTLAKLIRIENGVFGLAKGPVSWTRLDRALEANPEVLEAATLSARHSRSLLPRQARTPFLAMAAKAERLSEATEFFRKMEDEDTDPSSPARMLAFTLHTLQSHDSLDPDTALALAILAFEDFSNGKKATLPYSWRPDYRNSDLGPDGRPISMSQALVRSARNAGLPMMTGYPGLSGAKARDPAQLDTDMGSFSREMIARLNAVKGKGVRVVQITLTPDQARDWIEKFNTGNRSIQKTHVGRIARDIRDGNWMVNAQPICFAGDPFDPEGEARLLNGQHRLMACALAETEIDVMVAMEIPEEAFATYDLYRRRTKALTGVDASFARSAAVLQWREDRGLPLNSPERPTATEIENTLADHPGIARIAGQVRRADGKGRPDELGTGAVMTYIQYRALHEDPVIAEAFIEGLRSGEQLEAGNPILALRRSAAAKRKGTAKLSRYDAVEMLLEGWERYKSWAKRQGKAA